MQITLRKNTWLWFRSCQFSLAILFLPFMYFNYLNPESLTPRFANAIPYVFAMFAVCSIIALVMYLVWLFSQPTTITIDLERNEVRATDKVLFSFKPNMCCRLHSHSYKKPDWYRFHVENQHGYPMYHTPMGYQADIPYRQLLDHLEQLQRPFRIYHVPWIMRKEEQCAEDIARNERGEAFIKHKEEKNKHA